MSPRFPAYVYQVDIATHVIMLLTLIGLGLIVSFYEEAIKKNPWTLYMFSLISVAVIQVRMN